MLFFGRHAIGGLYFQMSFQRLCVLLAFQALLQVEDFRLYLSEQILQI